MLPSAGTQLERYVIQRLIGRGGMATVFSAKHTLLGTMHAIKVLREARGDVAERMIREGQLQARLDPRYVVPVTDILVLDSKPALVMPLVDGCTLADLLASYTPTDEENAYILMAIAEGLACAHEEEIVHRDLKPSNVLLDVRRGQVRVRVSDFGIARGPTREKSTADGVFLGTIGYASPEQIETPDRVDVRSDLWSLGVVAYELVMGQRPFQSSKQGRLLLRALVGDFDIDAVPPAWQPLIKALIQVEPSDRWQDVKSVQDWLRQAFGGEHLPPGNKLSTVIQTVRDRTSQSPIQPLTTNDQTGAHLPVTEATLSVATRAAASLAVKAFIGREQELDELRALVDDGERVLSIIGSGGTGKSALVREFALRNAENWPGGLIVADFSNANRIDSVYRIMAEALGVALSESDPARMLGRILASRSNCIIILDNIEHILAISYDAMTSWIDEATQALVLSTSRLVPEYPGELPWFIPGLSPDDARALFFERAGDDRSASSESPSAIVIIDKLMRELDYLPLAIELTAGQAGSKAPADMVAAIQNRISLLDLTNPTGGRHSSLRATLDTSWELLEPWEQLTLAQCAVFDGGFDLDAAQAIANLDDYPDAPWLIDIIGALVDHCLLNSSGDDRFTLSSVVRAYATDALEQLDQTYATHVRHGRYFAELGHDAVRVSLEQHGGETVRANLRTELGNISAACHRAVERQDADIAVATLRAYRWAVTHKGPYKEASQIAQRQLDTPGLTHEQRGWCALIAGESLHAMGDVREAATQLDLAITCFEQSNALRLTGVTKGALGTAQLTLNQHAQGLESLKQALGIFQGLNDHAGEVGVLKQLATWHTRKGPLDLATSYADRAYELQCSVGNPVALARTMRIQANVMIMTGRRDAALDKLEEVTEIARRWSAHILEARCHMSRGTLLLQANDVENARSAFQDALHLSTYAGNQRLESSARSNMAITYALEADWNAALSQFEHALAMQPESASNYARTLTLLNLAECYLGIGEPNHAMERAREALNFAIDIADRVCELRSRSFVARLHFASGHFDEAALQWNSCAHYGQTTAPVEFGYMQGGLAFHAALSGDADRARAWIASSSGVVMESGNPNRISEYMAMTAGALHLLGDSTQAKTGLQDALQKRDHASHREPMVDAVISMVQRTFQQH